jgi:predicted Zn-dependent protease
MGRVAFLLAFCLLAACQSAPVTGRSQMMLVSEDEERQLGARAYQQVLSREQPSHSVQLNSMVERVGHRIADAAEHPPTDMWKAPRYHWEFHTIAKNQVNAFCLPGGKIAVYSGILSVAQTDGELAAVLGHEVAHALARHSAERLSDQKLLAGGLLLASVAAAVATSRSTSGPARTAAPMAIAALGAGASVGILLPMSRGQESEADHIGLVLMAMAGYDPHEALTLWERMHALEHGKSSSQWLSTHPTSEARIADIKRWLPEAMKYYQPRDRQSRD